MRKFVNFEVLKEQGVFANWMAVHRAIKSCGFPKPYRFGSRRVAWDVAEVEAWIEARRGIPEAHKQVA